MSIHTILSEINSEAVNRIKIALEYKGIDTKRPTYITEKELILSSSSDIDGLQVESLGGNTTWDEFLTRVINNFATRIVEEVGKELIGEDDDEDLFTKDGHVSGFANMHRNSLRYTQRTKLQKMK